MTDINVFPDTARIWIYQANPAFSTAILPQVQQDIQQFTQTWVSHSKELAAIGTIKHQRFIILMVDEALAGASGCSIDKSVHFIQQLEQKYKVNLFDRMTFTYQLNGEVQAADRDTFSQLYQDGIINNDTLVFDNLIKTKGQLKTDWLKPLGESWHQRMV